MQFLHSKNVAKPKTKAQYMNPVIGCMRRHGADERGKDAERVQPTDEVFKLHFLY